MKEISRAMSLVLAVVAAIVTTGLMAGWSMWAWIVGYWFLLIPKNLADWMGGRRK